MLVNTTLLFTSFTLSSPFFCSFLLQSSILLLNLRNYPQHHAEKMLQQTGAISMYIVTVPMLFGITGKLNRKNSIYTCFCEFQISRDLWAFLKQPSSNCKLYYYKTLVLPISFLRLKLNLSIPWGRQQHLLDVQASLLNTVLQYLSTYQLSFQSFMSS